MDLIGLNISEPLGLRPSGVYTMLISMDSMNRVNFFTSDIAESKYRDFLQAQVGQGPQGYQNYTNLVKVMRDLCTGIPEVIDSEYS